MDKIEESDEDFKCWYINIKIMREDGEIKMIPRSVYKELSEKNKKDWKLLEKKNG